MIGDRVDIAGRLRSVLPPRWFGETTPVLDTLLNGIAAGWEYSYRFLQYTRAQTRLATASGLWLDLIAKDFFGNPLSRVLGQSDDAFRVVIQRNILRPLGTRTAVISALADLTGRPPIVFEPRNTADTGGYGRLLPSGAAVGGGAGYCISGGWGSLALPFQCFVTAFRPRGNGVAYVSGWGLYNGGYGVGTIEYADVDLIQGHVSDAEIEKALARTSPAGVVMWLNIQS